MKLKNIDPVVLYLFIGLVVFIISLGMGLINRSFDKWLPLIIALVFVMIFLRLRKKRTKIELFYDAVIQNGEKLKPLKKTGQAYNEQGIKYAFKLPTGMAKSDYERFREGLEQYLNKEVGFTFENGLLYIQEYDCPLEKYK